MKHIPLLLSVILLTGCAASTDQLHADAMGCGKGLIVEPNGIVRSSTEEEKSEQCAPAWKAYNKRLDTIAKREAEAAKCPLGTTKWCTKRGVGPQSCGCARSEDVRRALDRLLQ